MSMAMPALYVVALAFAFASFDVNGQNTSFLSGCGDAASLQQEMRKCYTDSGIDIDQLQGDLQAGLAHIQELRKEFKTLCANQKLMKMIECSYKVIEQKCPTEVYTLTERLYSQKNIKKVVSYLCENIDVFTSKATEICMENLQKAETKKVLSNCIATKSQEVANKMKEEKDPDNLLIMSVCYGEDVMRTCLKPAVHSCPNNGKHWIKLINLYIPQECSEYIDMSSATRPVVSITVLSLLAVITKVMF